MAPVTASGIFAVGAKRRVRGLYSSAFVVPPAAISTSPSGSRVAVYPDWATPRGPVATNVFGGPSPPAGAAAAVVASTGRIRPETRAPVQVSTATRWRAQRDRFITRQCHHAGEPKTIPFMSNIWFYRRSPFIHGHLQRTAGYDPMMKVFRALLDSMK